MSDTFDPYHVWLGIPPESRPPTHYEMLGISPKEQERAVIEAAVLRQSGYVRNFQLGKYAKDATKVLNEIGAAKACLLDPTKRADYDAELTAARPPVVHPPRHAAQRVLLTPPPAEFDLDRLVASATPAPTDLLGSSARALSSGGRIAPKRRLTTRQLRGTKIFEASRLRWQVMAGFVAGFAVALAIAALWPTGVEPILYRHEPPTPTVVTGDVYLETREPPVGRIAPPAEPIAPRVKVTAAPKVVQIKTQTYFWPGDIARHEGASFYIAPGGDFGWSGVSYELQGASQVTIRLKDVGTFRPMDDNFFAGFLVDYHTSTGYSHRAGLSIGRYTEKWRGTEWGAHVVGSRFVDLTPAFAFNEQDYLNRHADLADRKRSDPAFDVFRHWQLCGKAEGRHALFGSTEAHELNLVDWAPADWDGNAWFSVAISNAGAGAHIEGELIEPAPTSVERLPGEFRRLTGHSDSVAALAFMPNGQLLSGSFDTTWAIWDTKIGIAAERFRTDLGDETAVRSVAVSSSGSGMTALISNDKHVIHFDLLTRKALHGLTGHTGAVRCLAISADGRRAVSGGQDSKARYWDLDSGQQVWERDLPGWVYSAAMSRDGNTIVLGINYQGRESIRVFDATGNQIAAIKAGEFAVIGLSLSPDGKRCLAYQDPGIKLLDIESGAELAQFSQARGNGSRPVFSPDGRYAAWGGDEEFVSLWDIDRRQMIAQFEHAPLGSLKRRRHPQDWMPVAFSPDGKLLASGGDDGTIYLWDVGSIVAETADEGVVEHTVPTEHADFTPLDLSAAATVASTRAMFGGEEETWQTLVFEDWSPKMFEGVPFRLVDPQGDRVANVVMLYAPAGVLPPTMPTSVSVACNSPAKAIHFLSGVSGWGAQGELAGGSVSMIVRLHYADGETEDNPLRNGEHFADFVRRIDVPKSKLAFMLGGRQLRYFAVHPKRREPIERIDLVKGPDSTAPIVMAITVEGP